MSYQSAEYSQNDRQRKLALQRNNLQGMIVSAGGKYIGANKAKALMRSDWASNIWGF